MSGILEDGRVYRIFGSPSEFVKALKGSWAGSGMHGLPEYSSDMHPSVIIRSGNMDMKILLKAGRNESISQFRIFDAPVEKFPRISLRLEMKKWKVDPDISTCESEYYKMETHAMKTDEMYFLMEKIHPARRILFAGVLKKNGFIKNIFLRFNFIFKDMIANLIHS